MLDMLDNELFNSSKLSLFETVNTETINTRINIVDKKTGAYKSIQLPLISKFIRVLKFTCWHSFTSWYRGNRIMFIIINSSY